MVAMPIKALEWSYPSFPQLPKLPMCTPMRPAPLVVGQSPTIGTHGANCNGLIHGVGIGIAAKELVPIITASAVWGPGWHGEHVHFHSDNEAVVTIIQRRHARHPLLTNLLRCLFFYAALFHFHFSTSHIPGTCNTIADAISRNHLDILSSSLPQATQTVIPNAVSQFLLSPPLRGSPSWTELFNHSLVQVSPAQPLAVTTQASNAT